MARAALAWSTQDLAREAGVGVNTVNRFEAGQDARVSSMEKMRATLEAAGVQSSRRTAVEPVCGCGTDHRPG